MIKQLLAEPHPIYRRIAIHFINHDYAQLGDIFWSWASNPIEDVEATHELYGLIKDNCSSFSKEQTKTVLN
jgi:hypothetical protein